MLTSPGRRGPIEAKLETPVAGSVGGGKPKPGSGSSTSHATAQTRLLVRVASVCGAI